MGFRHVVMFRWAPGTPRADRDAAVGALRVFGEQIADLGAQLQVGSDAGVSEGSFDTVVVVDFPDAGAYRRYAVDPRHLELIARYIKPFLAERAAVQTEMP
ncbi:Dabb family protein [Jatrophihabitans sp. YIM 134969]